METVEIVGHAQTSFNGATHAVDKHGNTFCGTIGGDGRLFNDEWPGHIHVDDISCKRCLNRINKEVN